MAQPRKQRPFGDEVIKITGSVLHWDTICHQIMGGRENRLAILVTCGSCGQDRWVAVHQFDKRNEHKVFTGCCNHCVRKFPWEQKGRIKIPHIRHTSHGYIRLWKPDSPMADCRSEVYEHRFVMSQMLGRPLKRWEHIHHKDGNRTNNIPANLELVTTQQNHVLTDMITRIAQLETLLKQYHIPIPQ
uniref:Putative homing endonuclease n=1 Tax=viral metagenome TaxID=1070528 RepID=A0A6M3KV31_9ZZZZ